MTVAVITIVSGRHEHLRNQQIGLAHSLLRPDVYVVVSMDDPAAVEQTRAGPMSAVGGRLCTIMVGSGAALPLAAARNAGAATALAAGADQLIFLDVDCVPIPALVGAYVRSLTTADEPALHCGVVRYLGPEIDLRVVRAGRHLGEPHPARPNPPPGALQPSGEWALFWSLSFAVTASTWRRVGGFDESYVGYGGEDTDFGFRAHQLGINPLWVGGADALHQYHPTTLLPVQHVDDILRNATIFHGQWGFWPMLGWLEGFANMGLARFDAVADRWIRTRSGE